VEPQSPKTGGQRLRSVKMNNRITFAFLGDVMIGGEFITYAKKYNIEVLDTFRRISAYLDDVDILFLNLEGPIFNGPKIRPNVSSILSNHPVILKFFNEKLRIFNLSNNHIMDYCEEGLEQTVKLLRETGIYLVGAGRNLDEANKELIIDHDGRKIAFLAYCSNEPFVGGVLATRETSGCASYLELETVTESIKRLKSDVDVICVSLHWGHEYYFYPSHDQVKIAHYLAEAGAHLIIGHHPHVVQGTESYRGSLIAYSLGNFFLPSVRSISGRLEPRKDITKEFMVLKLTIGQAGLISLDLLGGRVERNFVLKPYDKPGQIRFTARVKELSKPLYSGNYSEFWENYRLRRDKGLERENLLEALKKLVKTPPRELAKTVTFADVKRNIVRLCRVISKSVITFSSIK
jgi:hypothetical protein